MSQLRATHATRVTDLTARQAHRHSLAALSLLAAPSETPRERAERWMEVLWAAIDEQHYANHRGPRDCCPHINCQARTEIERAVG